MDQVVAQDFVDLLARRFKRFAKTKCLGSSPLYYHLSQRIAEDHELLALASHCRGDQPTPTLFLGAVHFLLLNGIRDPLARFYSTLTTSALPPEEAYPHFRAFCFNHQDDLLPLLSDHLVQTNEIRRCSYLMPAFCLISSLALRPSLALVEIGTSAGLNLLWDRYGYHYEPNIRRGNTHSKIQIGCLWRGDKRPVLPKSLPVVTSRVGLDQHVLDLTDENNYLWLKALIWPEHVDRIRLLENAVEEIREFPPSLKEGSVLELLPSILKSIPADVTPVLFHTHTLHQFSPQTRQHFLDLVAEEGRRRELFHLAGEGSGTYYHIELQLATFQDGVRHQKNLAHCDQHGRWVEWLQ
jgi:hypothetical protein